MLKLIVIFAAIFCSAHCASVDGSQGKVSSGVLQDWAMFKMDYNKQYSSLSEEQYRFGVYAQNLQEIKQANAQPGRTFSMGMNEYGDMSASEMSHMNGARRPVNDTASRENAVRFMTRAAPTSKDWRNDGAVTPVKNQGQCGSCYSFSANGALETQMFRKTGKLVSLSEQNIVDCTKGSPYNNNGCNGGWMENAWKYVQDNGGLNDEKSYPYETKEGTCRNNKNIKAATVSGWTRLARDESQIRDAVANIGPIAVAIEVNRNFQMYKSGVYDDTCGTDVNHAVLITGYGTENGKDYWLVKNSWGTSWGEQGYIKMKRGKNLCGIADWATYPKV